MSVEQPSAMKPAPGEPPGTGLGLDLAGQVGEAPFSAYLEFFRRHLNQVYRFHLALLGSAPTAQAWTKETFLLAAGSLTSEPADPKPPEVRIFEIACSQYAGAKNKLNLPEVEFPPEVTSFDFQIIKIAERLSMLAPRQALILVLHFFAGQDLPTVACILDMPPKKIERFALKAFHSWLVQVQASFAPQNLDDEVILAQDLFQFVGAIHPDPKFAAELADQLPVEIPQRLAVPRQNPSHPRIWRPALPLPEKNWRGWSLVVLAGLILLLFITFMLTPRDRTSIQVSDTLDGKPDIALAESLVASDYQHSLHGYLVPPEQTICQDWKAALQLEFGTQVALTPSQHMTSITDDPERNGSACVLTAAPARQDLSAGRVYEQLSERLQENGYQREEIRPEDPAQGEISPGSFSTAFTQKNRFAFLSVDANQDGCDIQDGKTFCDPDEKPVRLRLELAEDRLRPQFTQFFDRWASADANLTQSMSAGLLSRLADLEALDRQAGVSRGPFRQPTFTWTILENDGDHVRQKVEAHSLGLVETFQALWVNQADKWVLDAVSTGVLFPPTQDRALVANGQGQVGVLDLDGGINWLTSAGFYSSISTGGSSAPPWVDISPDGKWAALSSNKSQQSWVVTLDGSRRIHFGERALAYSWSPDSLLLAVVLADRPKSLFVYDPSTKALTQVCTRDREIQSVSWSPDGKWIGMVEFKQEDEDQYTLNSFGIGQVAVEIYSPDQNLIRVLWKSQEYPGGAPNDLAWLPDSSELWYQRRLAFIIENGAVRRLINTYPYDSGGGAQAATGYSTRLGSDSLTGEATTPDGSYQAAWMAGLGPDGNLGTVSIQVKDFQNGESGLVVQSPYQVRKALWTSEGDNLLLAFSETQPGYLWRMNPFTGEVSQAGEGLILVGMISEMTAASADLVQDAIFPELIPDRDWASPGTSGWQTFSEPQFQVEFRVPPAWNGFTNLSGDMSAKAILANLRFDRDTGFFGLVQGAHILQVEQQSWLQGGNPFLFWQWLREDQAYNSNVAILDGHQVLLIERQNQSRTEYYLAVALQSQLITLYYFPTTPIGNSIFQDILASMRFKDDFPELSALVTDHKTPVEDEGEINAVVNAILPQNLEVVISRDEHWQAIRRRYGCLQTGPGDHAVEEIILLTLDDYSSRVVAQRLVSCADPAWAYTSPVFSPHGQTLYYTLAEEEPSAEAGLSESCGEENKSWTAVDTATGRQTILPVGSLSQDGQWMATWHEKDLLIWDLDGGVPIQRIPGALIGGLPGPIVWAPDGVTLVYALQSGCQPGARSKLMWQDLTSLSPAHSILDTPGFRVSEMRWPMRHEIFLLDEGGREWSFNPLDESLTPPGE